MIKSCDLQLGLFVQSLVLTLIFGLYHKVEEGT